MTKRLCLLLSLTLLLSCAPSATAPNRASVVGSQTDSQPGILPGSKGGILPGSKGGILPGSKGSILPGSKGDRNLIPSLELELRLPVTSSFSVAQVSQVDITGWQAELDGLTATQVRVTSQSLQGDEQALSLVLETLEPLTDSALHELIIYSPTGVVQSAALVPALSPAQTRLAAPLDSASLADWLLAREYQRAQGQPLLQIPSEVLRSLHGSPEAAALAKSLKANYRSSKGKSDPIAATAAETKAAADKLRAKPAAPLPSSTGKPADAGSGKPDSTGKPDTTGGKPE